MSDCGDRCITCSDEGVPMRVVSLSDEGAVCVDDDGSSHERVAVELVEPVAPGDRILVHAGVAIG
ncbi:MAG: HypC/HybG/HupF family hydrogenase formation chaperone [Solirubrobacteraceae bacterium]